MFDEEYIAYLNAQELDKEVFAKMQESEVNRAICLSIGCGIEAEGIGYKMGMIISPEIVSVLYRVNDIIELKNIPEKVVELFQLLKEFGVNDTKDVADYFSCIVGKNTVKVGNALKSAFEKMGVQDPVAKIKEIQDAVAKNETTK